MDAQSLVLLKNICKLIAIISGIFAAWLELKDRAQNAESREQTRAWYAHKWKVIGESKFLHLPEIAINWLLTSKSKALRWLLKIEDRLPAKIWFTLIMFVYPVLGGYSLKLFFGWPTFLIFIFLVYPSWIASIIYERVESLSAAILISINAAYIAAGILWIRIILNFSTLYTSLIMFGLLPISTLLFAHSFNLIASQYAWFFPRLLDPERWFLFGITMVLSFFLTSAFLMIGHIAMPAAYVPQTLQMFFSNVFFDGLTMLATFIILEFAIASKSKLSIPLAVVLDILFAAIFASASLWFGLLLTDKALTFKQTFFVLIGRSLDNIDFEIGPYFWVMHTVFLPTILYCGLILICWVSKVLVLPAAAVLSKGQLVEKPHHLTAGVFLLIVAVFSALTSAFDFFLKD